MAQSPIIRTECAHSINGVAGRYFGATVSYKSNPGCFARQRWVSQARPIAGYGKDAAMTVEIRFDDDCGNGHNTFAITAEVKRPMARDIEAVGCLHDDIARVFPELAPLIKWHLVSTDGPMHYIANTVFLAGDADCWGLRKGEQGKHRTGEGKARELESARAAACWPDAPDSILCADKATLTSALVDRLPALLADFESAVNDCGFLYTAPEQVPA